MKKPSRRIYVVQKAVDHKFKQHQGPIIYGQRFGQERRKKHCSGFFEKPKLDSARMLRGIYFIDPEDVEFQETTKKNCAKRWSRLWNHPCLVRCKEAYGENKPQYLHIQKCMHRRSSRIYEKAPGEDSTERS